MKYIFKKSNLPTLEKFAKGTESPRDRYWLARNMQDSDGYTANNGSIVLLLQQSAMSGDPWSMCELARAYFSCGDDVWLPSALFWWYAAVRQKDDGALWDIENLPIEARINGYSGGSTEYANIEMRCALLTEWILTRFGRDDWYALSFEEQLSRVNRLVQISSKHLHIKPPPTRAEFGFKLDGVMVDGAAYPAEYKLVIRKECFGNLHRLIQVIFHELGHFVAFSMWDRSDRAQMDRFGITDARIESWKNGTMGLEVVTSEEDPDTLSYGVYTAWLACFRHGHLIE